MRFEEYLNETTDQTFDDTKKAVLFVFKDLQKFMIDKNFFDFDDVVGVGMLNVFFKKYSIKFVLSKRESGSSNKLVVKGEFGAYTGSEDYTYRLYIANGFSKYFKRFVKDNKMINFLDYSKNQFMREMINILSHEILHAKQHINSGLKTFDPRYVNTEKYSGSYKDYLSLPFEIEAFAQNAAIETLNYGKSTVKNNFDILFNGKGKVWKTFMKKYSFYLNQLSKKPSIERLGKK